MSMRVVLIIALAVFIVSPALAQTPDRMERLTTASLFASSSISMVPVWITAACTTAGTCREVNPFMARLIGEGPVRAATVKAGFSFAAHYTVWRMPATTKTQKALRLSAALGLLAINTLDAVHDIRVMRRLDRP